MAWINPLDIPEIQIRQDYANHIIYGFVGAAIIALLFTFADFPVSEAWHWGYYSTLTLAVGKKVADYFFEKEAWQMCALKVAATVIIPLTLLVMIDFNLL